MAESSTTQIIKNNRDGEISSSDRLTNTIIGAWLFFLYLVTIVISILMLSSYQIQSRMQYVEVSGSRMSIWRLNELSDAYALNKKDLESQQVTLRQKENDLAGIRARIRELDGQYKPVFVQYYADIRKFKSDYEAASGGDKFVDLAQHRSSVKILFDDVAGQINESALSEGLKTRFRDLSVRHESGDDIFRNISSAKKNAGSVSDEIESFRAELVSAADRVKLGVNGIISADTRYAGLDDNEKGQLQDAVSEFAALKYIFWTIPYKLAIMPTEILVLFLVLAMGVLGSTIFITQLFFKRDKYKLNLDDDLNLAFFFSRPWFGAITALSIFVLAKAGVLFLTDPTTQGGGATLSPFFISFIAIISGLFSEQAIKAIKKAADNWFQDQNTFSDRWGIGLNSALKQKKRDKTHFCEAVGVPIKTVDEWLSEEKPVTAEMQEMLSAWLETPARILFTDLPPKSKHDEVQPPADAARGAT